MEKNSQIKKEEKRIIAKLQDLQQENARLREALESISKNTCCEPCQEAKKVAKKALERGE
jgi:hypothetical protein